MTLQVALNHRTHYKYDKPISLGPQLVRLRPAPHCRAPVLDYALKVQPAKHFVHWQQDPFGNHLARLIFPEKTSEFVVDVELLLDFSPINPFDFFLEPYAAEFPFSYAPDLAKDLEPYRALQRAGPLFQRFLGQIPREKRDTTGFLVDLNQRVRDAIGYTTRFDPGIQTCEETFDRRTGSCRDSGWLLVQILRHLGLAARFVSGYLIQLAPEPAKDSADLHAWAEVYLPGAGWIGLDPTSGMMAGEGHIPLASTPDASSAAPIVGTVELARVDFGYSTSIRRVNGSAPIANPFSDELWPLVEQVAQQVDADLLAQDVRLTMGGEPTFVGVDEPDSPQWNGDAMGPLKRDRAVALIARIRDKIAPGALLHFGQGKWYPGEPLPRWALSCHWRADGVPIWENDHLIAREDHEYKFGHTDALQFIEALANRLQV
ncbi:MAG: transglutaminase family protein, partial [Acidobacteriota bacterium]|nr:transglutaminase family protein [Acidobacteriota bacterium]